MAAQRRRKYTDREVGELDAVFGETVADTNRRDVLGRLQHCAQLEEIALHLLHKNSPESARELAMHRSSFGGVLRGHHVRGADFADRHSVMLEHKGYSRSRCVALVLVLDHEKASQNGRLERAGMIRTKNFLTCPLSRCTSSNCAFLLSRSVFECAASLSPSNITSFHNFNHAFPPDSRRSPRLPSRPTGTT